jgi:hypothetical protein
VKAGDWAKYSVTTYWQSNIPGVAVPQLIAQVQGISTMTTTVLSVTGDIVTASQVLTFSNGTQPKTLHLEGSILDGSGNVTIWIIAGGLSAGDKAFAAPTAPTINYTSVASFAGALRSMNVFNFSFAIGTISDFAAIQWERYSGLSFETIFSLTGNIDAGSVHYTARGLADIKLTQTSITHAPPDFSITGGSSVVLTAGTKGNLTLTLHSENGFAGKVSLTATSSPTGATIQVQPEQVAVPVDGQVDAMIILNSTIAGNYMVTITAAGGTLSHTKTDAFNVNARPVQPASFLQQYMLPIELAAVGLVLIVLIAIFLVVRRKPAPQAQPSPWDQPSTPTSPPTPAESPPQPPATYS